MDSQKILRELIDLYISTFPKNVSEYPAVNICKQMNNIFSNMGMKTQVSPIDSPGSTWKPNIQVDPKDEFTPLILLNFAKKHLLSIWEMDDHAHGEYLRKINQIMISNRCEYLLAPTLFMEVFVQRVAL